MPTDDSGRENDSSVAELRISVDGAKGRLFVCLGDSDPVPSRVEAHEVFQSWREMSEQLPWGATQKRWLKRYEERTFDAATCVGQLLGAERLSEALARTGSGVKILVEINAGGPDLDGV